MSFHPSTKYALWACPLILAITLFPPAAATARPAASEQQFVAQSALGSVSTTVGPTTVTLEPRTPAIPADGSFAYTARIQLSQPAESIQARLKILNPSGKLMIQQTRIKNDNAAGTVFASFERDMSDLELSPGAYPIQLEVRVSNEGVVTEGVIDGSLLVYDARRASLPFAIAVRVSGQPLADPQGRFVADPARYTRARDDVNELAAWVVSEQDARISLAISPVLLSEWDRIAGGYELVGPEGTTQVGADQVTPKAYAATVSLLRQAAETGRLELTTQGYADPDLSALAGHDMVEDIGAHYAKGLSATFGSTETSPSTGTVPAGMSLPAEAGTMLTSYGVEYVVMGQTGVRFKRANAAPGVYRIEGSALRILVTDDELSTLVSLNDSPGQLRRAFERATAAGARGPLIMRCEVGPGATSPDAVIAAAASLARQPWLRLRLTRDIAARVPSSAVRLVDVPEDNPAPKGYWNAVKQARDWARALTAALAEQAGTAQNAEDDSLIAQCSAWAGPEGGWEFADRGRLFADTARRSSRDVLSAVSLHVETMTLAGNSDEVPVIITNGGDLPLLVDVRASASKGLEIVGEESQRITLSPQDNFIQLPVEMPDALRGKLTVTVSSAGVILDEKTVDVSASYLDRLVIIAAVVLLLGIMLVFIIRRVRTAESTADVSEHTRR